MLFRGQLVVVLADTLRRCRYWIRSIFHDFWLSWWLLLVDLVPWVGKVGEMLLGIDHVIQLVLQPLTPLLEGLVVPL